MKKLIPYVIFLTLLLLLASCSGKHCMMKKRGCDMKAELESLMETDREVARHSMEHGMAEAFHEYFAEDGIQISEGDDPVYGRDKIFEGLQGNDTEFTLDWEPEDGQVSVSGDMGWTWGRYVLTFNDTDKGNMKGKYVSVWVKNKEGKWRVKVDIGN